MPLVVLSDYYSLIGLFILTDSASWVFRIENLQKCQNCGNPVAPGMIFCESCGARIEALPAHRAVRREQPGSLIPRLACSSIPFR